MSKDVALWDCSLWGSSGRQFLGRSKMHCPVWSLFASLALWRLAVPAGCPSLTLLPRGQHKEHHLSMSAQA